MILIVFLILIIFLSWGWRRPSLWEAPPPTSEDGLRTYRPLIRDEPGATSLLRAFLKSEKAKASQTTEEQRFSALWKELEK